ncbi:hypothetical protein B0H14DRAFT_3584754 [Mycena olivaceomarginata]|nr:hypothetical protein B0H14DRAFT_3584754 [Mycena olivaceomarginata]
MGGQGEQRRPFPVFDAGKTLARCDLRIGSTICGSKHLLHACGVDTGLRFAILRQDHVLKSNQIRPPSLKTAPVPHAAALVSLNFQRIVPTGAMAGLQGHRRATGRETAVGVLSSRLSTIFCNAASSQCLRAQSLSPRRPRCRTSQGTHANGWLKSRETIVPRHQILSALLQNHRAPPRGLRGPPTTILLADTFMLSAKLGLSTGRSGALVPPGARTTSACEPGSIAPPSAHRTSYGASKESVEDSPWNSLAPFSRGLYSHLDPHALPPASRAICVRARGFGWVDSEEDDRGVGGRVRVPVARGYFGMLEWDGGG